MPAKKEAATPNDFIQRLISTGCPVKRALFQGAVQNGRGEPEMNFNMESTSIGRKVLMWHTDKGLMCFHNNRYFLTPMANCLQVDY